MANDYNGYIATYREYQRGDHYRKALTAWGPHSSRLHGHAAGRAGRPAEAAAPAPRATRAARRRRTSPTRRTRTRAAQALGALADQYVAAYEATLPDDGGTPARSTAAEGRRALRRGVCSPGSAGRTTPTTRSCGRAARPARWEPLRRPLGRDPGDRKFPQLGDVPAYATGSFAVALDGALRGVRLATSTTWASGRGDARRDLPLRRARAAARGAQGRAVHAALARVHGGAVGRDHGAVDRARRSVVQRRTGVDLPVSEAGRSRRSRQGERPGWRRRRDVGPIDYPDSYGGRSSSTRPGPRCAIRPTTRRGSSGSASTARSGRGRTRARCRARR